MEHRTELQELWVQFLALPLPTGWLQANQSLPSASVSPSIMGIRSNLLLRSTNIFIIWPTSVFLVVKELSCYSTSVSFSCHTLSDVHWVCKDKTGYQGKCNCSPSIQAIQLCYRKALAMYCYRAFLLPSDFHGIYGLRIVCSISFNSDLFSAVKDLCVIQFIEYLDLQSGEHFKTRQIWLNSSQNYSHKLVTWAAVLWNMFLSRKTIMDREVVCVATQVCLSQHRSWSSKIMLKIRSFVTNKVEMAALKEYVLLLHFGGV